MLNLKNLALGLLAVLPACVPGLAGEAAAPAPAPAPAAPAEEAEPAGRGVTIVTLGRSPEVLGPGAIIPSVDFKGENLQTVLEFLSARSGINIKCPDDKALEMPIAFKLNNVSWRQVLEYLAEKYGLVIDDSHEAARLILVKSPPKVELDFPQPTDVHLVIAAIREKAGANIIVGPEVKGTVSLSLKNVPWEEALGMVARTLNFVVVRDKYNTYRLTTASQIVQQLETRIIPLAYVQGETSRYVATMKTEFAEKVDPSKGTAGAPGEPISLLGVLRGMTTDKIGKILYHRETNTLVVTDTPAKLEAMQRLIQKLDVPPKQVHLAVRMVELTDSESEELGVEWANGLTATLTGMAFDTAFPFDSGGGDNAAASTLWGRLGIAPTAPPTRWENGPGWGAMGDGLQLGRLSFLNLQATLHFIRTRTRGSVIQAPSLNALDNTEATIHVGRSIRYAEYFVESTENGIVSGYREASDSPIKEGVQLLVIPHVTGPTNDVLLTILPKTEALESWKTFGAGNTILELPQTKDRIAVTRMLLHNAETGVIGGLKETMTATTETEVPFLADIPVLGWLFKSRAKPSDLNRRSNLLIFITPTVIDFLQEGQVPEAVRQVRRKLAGPFFSYEEQGAEEAAGERPPEGGVR